MVVTHSALPVGLFVQPQRLEPSVKSHERTVFLEATLQPVNDMLIVPFSHILEHSDHPDLITVYELYTVLTQLLPS